MNDPTKPSPIQLIKLGLLPGYPIEIRSIGKNGTVQLMQKTKQGWHGGNTYSSVGAAKDAIK